MDSNKQKIIDLFISNLKGKTPTGDGRNPRHDGAAGHWVEEAMGLRVNGENRPDIYGYEMKSITSAKFTYGDWQADEYIYRKSRGPLNKLNIHYVLDRDNFLEIFGQFNQTKHRYSWSGTPCPQYYNQETIYGQKLFIDDNEDIVITYSFDKDQRPDKSSIIPIDLQKNNLIIARWFKDEQKKRLERKFNDKGWFTFERDHSGRYTKICFGNPITYEVWIDYFKNGNVFFDSGMYQGNQRPYATWRSVNSFMRSLIVEKY